MRKELNQKESSALITAALDDGPRGIVVILCALTGARANEVLRITGRDISLERVDIIDEHGLREREHVNSVVDWHDITIEETTRCMVKVKASKRGKDRLIPIDKQFHKLMKLLKFSLEDKPLYRIVNDASHSLDTAYEIVRKYFAALQLRVLGHDEFTLHCFRHTVAMRVIRDGNDVLTVKRILGHKSIGGSYEYIKRAEDERDIALIMGLVSPKKAL